MNQTTDRTKELIQGIDASHRRFCSAGRELFAWIAESDREKVWRDSGARDMTHFIRMRLGISEWKATRWIAASHALEGLPRISEAMSSGELGIDKVVELTRFATPDAEEDLLRWAKGVSCGAIRHKGDLALRQSLDEVNDAEKGRTLRGGTSTRTAGSVSRPSSPLPTGRWCRRPWSVSRKASR